ncbi:hypothetical protein Anas_09530 [Armadillidium nasatum]|uniref:Uncharacterized protein n=1 Tax=Armadillidium nasatum TaxID=96803 RepID=A0A5N5TG23_9CRUS|nr:hypothetical protein Anas_09530 [Armadillidium nasatum]
MFTKQLYLLLIILHCLCIKTLMLQRPIYQYNSDNSVHQLVDVVIYREEVMCEKLLLIITGRGKGGKGLGKGGAKRHRKVSS